MLLDYYKQYAYLVKEHSLQECSFEEAYGNILMNWFNVDNYSEHIYLHSYPSASDSINLFTQDT